MANEIREIVEVIGREDLRAALGLKNDSSIRAAIANEVMPAPWWPVVKAKAKGKRIKLEERHFAFKAPQEAAE